LIYEVLVRGRGIISLASEIAEPGSRNFASGDEKNICDHKINNKFMQDFKKLFLTYKEKLQEIYPDFEIEHVGGSSIPEALTKGDLDIAVRIPKEKFLFAISEGKKFYEVYHPTLWSEHFALLVDWVDETKVNILLVVKDGPWDTYVLVRDFLISNKGRLREYNEIKDAYLKEAITKEEYFAKKDSFFKKVLHQDLKI
jgi:GrpB-like predicted nucleotidyltransferase (UPF0157 family)